MAFSENNFFNIAPEVSSSILLTIIAFLSFIILNVFADERRLKVEYEFMKILREKEKRQYQISKDLIEEINIKCHDLKHQINHIKASQNNNGSYLDELEKNVYAFQNNVNSGNKALDIIFFEKMSTIKENKITLITDINSSYLDNIKEEDIYSLFGNIIDNAIESTIKVDEKNRLIELTVKPNKFSLYICCKNPFVDNITFKNGIPLTKKQNTIYHGFGTKSIKNIIKKYDGFVDFSANNGFFEVKIMIPIK